MKKIVESIRKVIKKIIRGYIIGMKQYGEALLRGGSYGCA